MERELVQTGTAALEGPAKASQDPCGEANEKHALSRKREDELGFRKEDESWRRRVSSKKEEASERYWEKINN